MNKLHQKIAAVAAIDLRKIAIQSEQTALSYQALLDEIKTAAKILIQQSTPQTYALLLDNQIAWAVIDLALMFKKQIAVPLPSFFSASQINHVIQDAGVDYLIIDEKYVADLEQSGIPIQSKKTIIIADKKLLFLNLKSTDKKVFEAHSSGTKITYTSGTTGTPKGVILSNDCILAKVKALAVASATTAEDKSLSILPLSTLLENIGGLYVALYCGATATIIAPETLGLQGSSQINATKLLQAISTYQPTAFIIIPQFLLLFLQAIKQGVQLPASIRFIAMGGAPVSKQLLMACAQLKLPIFEGYGLSEAASVIALNTPSEHRLGSVGKVLPTHQVKITNNGSILVKNNLFDGYLGVADPIHDFYDTGDLGELDEDGFLYITGRKTQVLHTAYGRNISPEWVEKELEAMPLIAQAIVIGHARPFLIAVIVPRMKHLDMAAYQLQLNQGLKQLNETLPDYARIQQFILADSAFTVENNQLTGTARPKRTMIEAAYRIQIARCYQQQSKIKKKEQQKALFFNQLMTETAQARQMFQQIDNLQKGGRGDISLMTYQAFLTQAYHHVKHTTPLLMSCGGRLSAENEWLRNAIAEYIEEELGHQEWILNDLKATGVDAEAIRTEKPDQSTELMIAYAYYLIDRVNPVAFFGMVLVLEGTSIALATQAAKSIQQALDLPDSAFSYLSSHGSLDIEHMGFYEKLMNKITNKQDQQAIIDAANMFYLLYGNIFRALPV